ncbi:MAG TPA: hydroxyethylthiazole kinase [Treponemataceae bacterium]|nr:hydroxyethylthiazole kinase [Treponemataceae bacterium]HPS43453.1 hydroxyethylthiazole kinase [Treponemataceae bacterium]
MQSDKNGGCGREGKARIALLADAVRDAKPLVHCITNYVTVNDCANAILASGGAPVMADDEAEAACIAGIADALVINIGTLNARTIRSMELAGLEAARRGIPIVLDPVGAGASPFRTETALSLLGKIPFTVIRGNASEIRTLASGTGTTRGVDASEADARETGLDSIRHEAIILSLKAKATVAVTGETDIVTDGKRSYAIRNGHPLMGRITGSGCMLTALLGAYAGANGKIAAPLEAIDATAAALCAMGIAGERAARTAGKAGTGSYRVALIDALSQIGSRDVLKGMKLDAR